MGSQVQKQAAIWGLTKLRLTTLYAQPRRFRLTLMKMVPDLADIIRDYINFRDPSLTQDRSGGGRNDSYYFLSQKAQIYVELFNKLAPFLAKGSTPQDYVICIKIYCENEEDIRGIAQAVTRGEDRVKFLAHIDWKKIEGKFRVKTDDCLAEWKNWLAHSSAAAFSSLQASRPPTIKRQTALILQIIFYAAAVLFFVIYVIVFILGVMQWVVSPTTLDIYAIAFNIYLWFGIGCVIAGSILGIQKKKAEQYLLEQRLLSEEKQQQEIVSNTPPSPQYYTAPPLSPHSPGIQPIDSVICNQCGLQNTKDAHFCKNCGSALE
jgi:hypothetical protein